MFANLTETIIAIKSFNRLRAAAFGFYFISRVVNSSWMRQLCVLTWHAIHVDSITGF